MINISDIQNAREAIKTYVHKTPIIFSNSFSKLTGAEVYLKTENLQKTGSFKVRGAFNKIINISESSVIAASMGNHAQGVAFASSSLGKHSIIVMPLGASMSKEEAARGYGAEVVLRGQTFQEALDYAMSRKDHVFLHTFDDDHIIAGQGTIGLEIMEDIQNVDHVLVPVGGGGLIAGIATAVKSLSPATQVIGIQTEAATSAHVSFKEKRITERTPMSTLADGIAIGRVGEKTLEVINRFVDDFIVVTEDAIAMSILLFLERKKLVVEGAGAVPLAGLLENTERFRGKRVVLIVSGGNIDFTLIDRIIHKGLVSSGRIGSFETIVDDVPGSLHEITGTVASQRGNILKVEHDRFLKDLPVGKTRIIVTVETRGRGHLESMISHISSKGLQVRTRTEG